MTRSTTREAVMTMTTTIKEGGPWKLEVVPIPIASMPQAIRLVGDPI